MFASGGSAAAWMVADNWAGIALTVPNGSSGYRPASEAPHSVSPNSRMNAC